MGPWPRDRLSFQLPPLGVARFARQVDKLVVFRWSKPLATTVGRNREFLTTFGQQPERPWAFPPERRHHQSSPPRRQADLRPLATCVVQKVSCSSTTFLGKASRRLVALSRADSSRSRATSLVRYPGRRFSALLETLFLTLLSSSTSTIWAECCLTSSSLNSP